MSNKEIIKLHDKSDKLTRERDDRCLPVAKCIIKMIVEFKGGKFGSLVSAEQAIKSVDKLALDILALLLNENVKVNEISYIFTLIEQIVRTPKDIVIESVNAHFSKADNKLWGKDLKDVTVGDLEKVLKKS